MSPGGEPSHLPASPTPRPPSQPPTPCLPCHRTRLGHAPARAGAHRDTARVRATAPGSSERRNTQSPLPMGPRASRQLVPLSPSHPPRPPPSFSLSPPNPPPSPVTCLLRVPDNGWGAVCLADVRIWHSGGHVMWCGVARQPHEAGPVVCCCRHPPAHPTPPPRPHRPPAPRATAPASNVSVEQREVAGALAPLAVAPTDPERKRPTPAGVRDDTPPLVGGRVAKGRHQPPTHPPPGPLSRGCQVQRGVQGMGFWRLSPPPFLPAVGGRAPVHEP